MATGGVGEAMLISAITGATTSAVTGGDPLKGALLGAATGGIGAGAAGAGTGAAAGAGAAPISTIPVGDAASLAAQASTEQALAQGLTDPGVLQATGADMGFNVANAANAPGAGFQLPAGGNAFAFDPVSGEQLVTGMEGVAPAGTAPMRTVAQPVYGQTMSQTAGSPMFPKIAEMSKSDYFYPGLGVFGSVIGDRPRSNIPGADEYSGSLSRFSYDPDKYRPYRAASGGLMDTMPAKRMATGGDLGSYSDGGQLLKGPGDGMSDDIPASIGGDQPALLADGEFVVPADVVSGLGNGSTDAGARELYAMMERVRKARTGRERQAPEIDTEKYLPA